ncbi:LCP family protein [Alkalihalobacillus hwajinpoensis]|uniref:LCP family glycopolymer transferase n=1 Tax=Guptibacillus hwajinpoensis TaxID=208199 RepID=UPI0018836D71|nr:LCP family protein [Pseudalkalibacillus hwajinpoensis]MBF0705634.1 LCP family protein [Pseudalkalibacillus hwajinpoensis]
MKKQSRIKRRRKKSLFRRLLTFVLLIVLVLIGYGAYLAYNAYDAASGSYQGLSRGEKSALRDAEVAVTKDPISILIMGIEDYSTGGDNGRTDTLMVATVDPDSKKVKLLSIPRDSRVEIVGKGIEDKITHAHAYGGTEMTINTVENFLNIPIDYYVKVNFEGFKDVIDEIGGITVDVPFDFIAHTDVPGGRATFTEGPMNLDGTEALAYARMRKDDPRGDFGRSDRQKQVIKAAMDEVSTASGLLKLDDIAQHIGNNIETNLKPTELFALQKAYSGVRSSDIESLTIDGSDERINNVYYFKPDEESVASLSQQLNATLNSTK